MRKMGVSARNLLAARKIRIRRRYVLAEGDFRWPKLTLPFKKHKAKLNAYCKNTMTYVNTSSRKVNVSCTYGKATTYAKNFARRRVPGVGCYAARPLPFKNETIVTMRRIGSNLSQIQPSGFADEVSEPEASFPYKAK